jgi:hypothetical protein
MKRTYALALIAASLAAPAALAQQPAAGATATTASTPGKRVDTNTVTVTAKVEAVDRATRAVTLRGPENKPVTITAGPEVKNFDMIKAGDMVVVKYVEALSIELKKGGTAPVAKTESGGAATAKKGENPGVVAGREVKVVTAVTAMDDKKQTVTLKGPDGTPREVKVQDPAQYKLAKVGDQVEITYTEAIAIALDPAPAAPAKAPAKSY